MRAIITTTINAPTRATRAFADFVSRHDGWRFIIVGDTKTPHEAYHQLERQNRRVLYLSPDMQDALMPELSAIIGWRTIRRRNIGFMSAYHLGAELFATVDDDNIPLDNWGQNIVAGQEVEYEAFRNTSVDCFEPLSVSGLENIWHRGYPLDYRASRNDIEHMGRRTRRCLVQADLWNGDPDIDAMVRIVNAPEVDLSNVPELYGSQQIAPFNSQNTFIHRDAMPFYAVLPGIGRMDDIWGAYVLQAHLPGCVLYGRASVYQERNPQDLIKNLEEEMLGYRRSLDFIKAGKDYEALLPDQAARFWSCYRKCISDKALAARVTGQLGEFAGSRV